MPPLFFFFFCEYCFLRGWKDEPKPLVPRHLEYKIEKLKGIRGLTCVHIFERKEKFAKKCLQKKKKRMCISCTDILVTIIIKNSQKSPQPVVLRVTLTLFKRSNCNKA